MRHAFFRADSVLREMRFERKVKMQPNILMDPAAKASWSVIHPLSEEDSAAVAALRSVVAAMKGKFEGTAGHGPFNDILERVAVPQGVTFEAATVAGISGWWAKPARAEKGAAIIHVHGGWFNWGTAQAFRNFVGPIALSGVADAFIPDYRLAPEDPFPAAIRDLEACYRGLVDKGITKIALTGDSAGGNLALVLLSIASAQVFNGGIAPVGAVAFSPITDLALTGESFETRAEADRYFTKSQAAGLVCSHLGETDPKNPLASPLYADLSGLPPIRVQVGDDEVLLDDSRRYVEHAVAAGVDAKLDVGMGMLHGFVTNVGEFNAARQALNASGTFLTERLGSTRR
jgi:monoterpene epsilon-lactone hydrolase